jgi:hypothetical protein
MRGLLSSSFSTYAKEDRADRRFLPLSYHLVDGGGDPIAWVDYKAPHANRGTPARARKGKLRPKLFKGHRP